MSGEEYSRREALARYRLGEAGHLFEARDWLRENKPPPNWKGTPLEYAETEMPVNLFGFFRWIKSQFA
jgi:hypothetical protein